MPEVGMFDSPDPNAFATGANKNNALVAVSTGLLNNMRRDEVEAVLGHEVSHVANGDMVTLTLIQGVMNTFVFFLARVIGFVVDRVILKNERGAGIGYLVTVIVAQVVLGILAGMIVAWFSRKREFRADAGGAYLAGHQLDDRRARSAQARVHSPTALPEKMAGLRHPQRPAAGLAAALHEPPAAGRANCGTEQRALTAKPVQGCAPGRNATTFRPALAYRHASAPRLRPYARKEFPDCMNAETHTIE